MVKTILHKTLIPLNRFMHYEHSGGIALFVSVILALLVANSPYGDAFHHFWETELQISFMDLELNYTLHQWVNDGLMAMFFFVVGLELKREIIAGELSSFRNALLPIGAAIGGMLVPALFYFFINDGLPSVGGWGIPMATDIVFSLALLGLVSKKVPLAVKIFLVALATVDDLGAVLVIAFFYSSSLSFLNLYIGLGLLALLLIANFLGVRKMWFYAIIGIGGVWLTFLLSGVHATIAGVLVAFAIPCRTKIKEEIYSKEMHELLKKYDEEIPLKGPLITQKQHQLIEEMKNRSLDAQAPLQKLEIGLHPWVTFLVIPLFALSNAGVVIGSNFFSDLMNPVTIGIVVGLIAGKFIGVTLFTWILVKLKVAGLPENATWTHIMGVACLAGVGFTMSLFVTNLAFESVQLVEQAKYGILLASLIAGVLGVLFLKSSKVESPAAGVKEAVEREEGVLQDP